MLGSISRGGGQLGGAATVPSIRGVCLFYVICGTVGLSRVKKEVEEVVRIDDVEVSKKGCDDQNFVRIHDRRLLICM